MKKIVFKLKIIASCLLLTSCNFNKSENKVESTKTTNWKVFIPQNMEVTDSISCDFNKDKIDDIAFVLKSKKAVILKNDTICFGDSIYFPKKLIVLLNKQSKGYEKIIETSTIFGTCNWGIQGTDAYSNLTKRKNTLGIIFSSGGTLRTQYSYYFGLKKNDFELIGATSNEYQVPNPEQYITDINLLTGIKETYEGSGRKNYTKENIGKKQPIKLLTFEPLTNIDPLREDR
ncbi:hypothetical protein [Flavobacterium marginilacus]|uniref:hypothetical protein n=1 Tax=Flavobacterium marginilacus TaxID=3003256 RepID=UPI00248DEC3E|nr:hypothetical protein [Flavobacterium marginilacus]